MTYRNRWYLGVVLTSIFIGIISMIIYYSFKKSEEFPHIHTITVDELKVMIEKEDEITVVDLRIADSFRRGSIPGAVNIPSNRFNSRIAELANKEKVVLLSPTGEMSMETGKQLLRRQGTTEVYVLKGGIAAFGD